MGKGRLCRSYIKVEDIYCDTPISATPWSAMQWLADPVDQYLSSMPHCQILPDSIRQFLPGTATRQDCISLSSFRCCPEVNQSDKSLSLRQHNCFTETYQSP